MEAQLYSTRASATRLPGKHWAVPYNSSLLPRSRARARCGVGAFAPLECFEGGVNQTQWSSTTRAVLLRCRHRRVQEGETGDDKGDDKFQTFHGQATSVRETSSFEDPESKSVAWKGVPVRCPQTLKCLSCLRRRYPAQQGRGGLRRGNFMTLFSFSGQLIE